MLCSELKLRHSMRGIWPAKKAANAHKITGVLKMRSCACLDGTVYRTAPVAAALCDCYELTRRKKHISRVHARNIINWATEVTTTKKKKLQLFPTADKELNFNNIIYSKTLLMSLLA